MKPERLLFIDGLRGLAVSLVVIYHLGRRTDAEWLFATGYLGVAIFFVLSGYVITLAVGTKKITPGFLLRFVVRRSARLDPPYWISIVVVIGLMYVATILGEKREFPSILAVFIHMFYLQDLLSVQTLSTVYWTLCLEVQFYLVLILLLLTRWPITLLCCLLVWSLLENANIVNVAANGLFIHFWFGFAAGALTYWTSTGRFKTQYLYMILTVIALFGYGSNGAWCIVTVLTAVALHVATNIGRMGSWLSGRFIQVLGKISYSLYLLHPIVGWSAQSFALRYMNQWGALFVGLTISLLSAVIMYVLIERPAIKLSHWISLNSEKN